tara:strand:+ start:9148 stop:10290 length:1143 start_codon:yes stop_codon:yes gene_type:complete
MAKIKQIFLFIFLILLFSCSQEESIKCGAERTNEYLPLIKNKRVAIIGNQTSRIGKTHLVDSLISFGINITKVFSPEHGFRGSEDAGAIISDDIDPKTGLTIVSLYGTNKKPNKNQLKEVDILIFDIQDVGARFYTYISTLHYVMEAAAENNIEIIILDRPNPNGHYIDGPIREAGYESFVGMHPIPIVHGMTIGEYAKMINGEKWISKKCNLRIIRMENYSHKSKYNLPIRPSPNLPNQKSINLYPSLCLFEGTIMSVGRGTDFPFQHFGAPFLKSSYEFTPTSRKGSISPKYQDLICYGNDLRNISFLKTIRLDWIINAYNLCPEKDKFFNSFFDKLAGNSSLREQIISGKNEKEIKEKWNKDLNQFKLVREKYLIYK